MIVRPNGGRWFAPVENFDFERYRYPFSRRFGKSLELHGFLLCKTSQSEIGRMNLMDTDYQLVVNNLWVIR